MKLTRRELKELIKENLLLETEVGGWIGSSIQSALEKANITDEIKAGVDKAVNSLDALKGTNLIHFANTNPLRKVFLKAGVLGTLGTAGAGIFGTYSLVGGVFTALPAMINKTISALNTVPGKLKNYRKIKGEPVEYEDLASKSSGVGREIAKNFGIKAISKDEMVDMLAIDKGMEDGKNTAEKLRKEGVISEDFYGRIVDRYLKLRDSDALKPDKVKKELAKTIKAALDNGDEDFLRDLISTISTVVL